MNNFDLYKLINFVVNKDVYAQAMNESEFELELQAKNIRHFRNRLGLPEGYRTGTVVSAVESTRINQHDLTPFLVTDANGGAPEFNVVNGKVTIPDVSYVLDFFTEDSRSADIISYQEISLRLKDPQLAPTTKDLAAYVIKDGLKVYPESVEKVNVVYYREPQEPKFVINTNLVTLEMEYDSTQSVELEWDDGNKLDIMHMILMDMSINISRADVSQYAMKLVEQGK